MGLKQIFDLGTKVLSNKEIKEYGKKCIAAGVNIQKKRDYEKYKKVIAPIVAETIKHPDPNTRRIGGKLLQSFKKFK